MAGEFAQPEPRRRFLVQFLKTPQADDWRRMAEWGIRCSGYVTNSAYAVVAADEVGLEYLRQREEVRAFGALRPGDKILSSFPRQGQVLARVWFWPDVDYGRACTVLGPRAELPPHLDRRHYERTRSLPVALPAESLESLAALDDVAALERLSWKRVPLTVPQAASPRRPANDQAADFSGAKNLKNAGWDGLTAAAGPIRIGEWDEGQVRETHTDLAGRVSNVNETPSELSGHATHVCGTMIGDGTSNPVAKGMAPKARVEAWNLDYFEDQTFPPGIVDFWGEIEYAITSQGIHLSNHSWGYAPANFGGELLGQYNSETARVDGIAYDEGHLMVFPTGNWRNKIASPGSHAYGGIFDPASAEQYPYYDVLSNVACAKNAFGVGAVEPLGAPQPNGDDCRMTYFSSWGPADDGRLKPDFVTDGAGLLSTAHTSNTAYSTLEGTSQAAPVTSGCVALFYEAYLDRVGVSSPPPLDFTRALFLHSCLDVQGADDRVGPDYAYGFGKLRADAAVAHITAAYPDSGPPLISYHQATITQGEVHAYALQAPAAGTLRVTLAWSDPPPSPLAAPALVNDLDLRLLGPAGVEGTVHHPWRLRGATPAALAVRGPNRVDTVEQVEFTVTDPGAYTVEVQGGKLENPLYPTANYTVVAGFRAKPPPDPPLFAPLALAKALPVTPPAIATIAYDGADRRGVRLDRDSYRYYRVVVPEDAETWTIKTQDSGAGDAQLFLRKGLLPTTAENDAAENPLDPGQIVQDASSAVPLAPGVWYIGVYAAGGDVVFSLATSGTTAEPSAMNYVSDTKAGTVAEGGWVFYAVDVPAAPELWVLELNCASGDADLYVRFGERPSEDRHEAGAATGAAERIALDSLRTGSALRAGRWYVGVCGWSAASFTLKGYGYSASDGIAVATPAAGQVLNSGAHDPPFVITWNSTFAPERPVQVVLSFDGGATEALTIADEVPNSGSYIWNPLPGVASNQINCVVRVRSRDLPRLRGDSGVFTIRVDPTFTLTDLTVGVDLVGHRLNDSVEFTAIATYTGTAPMLYYSFQLDGGAWSSWSTDHVAVWNAGATGTHAVLAKVAKKIGVDTYRELRTSAALTFVIYREKKWFEP